MAQHYNIVGTSPLRKEGRAKVLGQAKYVDDLSLPRMWHGATVRSAIARGRIRAVHFAAEIDWSEFAIVRASDIPGENTIVHLTKDHPCLARKTSIIRKNRFCCSRIPRKLRCCAGIARCTD